MAVAREDDWDGGESAEVDCSGEMGDDGVGDGRKVVLHVND